MIAALSRGVSVAADEVAATISAVEAEIELNEVRRDGVKIGEKYSPGFSLRPPKPAHSWAVSPKLRNGEAARRFARGGSMTKLKVEECWVRHRGMELCLELRAFHSR